MNNGSIVNSVLFLINAYTFCLFNTVHCIFNPDNSHKLTYVFLLYSE